MSGWDDEDFRAEQLRMRGYRLRATPMLGRDLIFGLCALWFLVGFLLAILFVQPGRAA